LTRKRRKPYLADLGANVLRHRLAAKLTSHELAKRAGLKDADILHLESGDISVRQMPISELFPMLERIGGPLGVYWPSLFEECGDGVKIRGGHKGTHVGG
jgi:hypothetical protein